MKNQIEEENMQFVYPPQKMIYKCISNASMKTCGVVQIKLKQKIISFYNEKIMSYSVLAGCSNTH